MSFSRFDSRSKAIRTTADEMSQRWSYQTFYSGVLQKIADAIKKNDLSFDLKLTSADKTLVETVKSDLTKDGFEVRESDEVPGEPSYKKTLLISGWAKIFKGKTNVLSPDSDLNTYWLPNSGLWDRNIDMARGRFTWLAGERVASDLTTGTETFETIDPQTSDGHMLFIGQSGSGKTELMRFVLTSYLVMNPSVAFDIIDFKRTSDYLVYAPFTSEKKIMRTEEDADALILKVAALTEDRLKKYGGLNREELMAAFVSEEITPYVLVIDEAFVSPHFNKNRNRESELSKAVNLLLMKGSSFGVTLIIGSQLCIPKEELLPELASSLRNRFVLRVGTVKESHYWLGSDKAFQLGKTCRKKNGGSLKQIGYAYLNDSATLVRGYLMDDFIIHNELKMHRNIEIPDSAKTCQIPVWLKLKEDKDALTPDEKNDLNAYKKLIKAYEDSLKNT